MATNDVRQMAERMVEQWDRYDRFRFNEGGEPKSVIIAREFLRLLLVMEQAGVSDGNE